LIIFLIYFFFIADLDHSENKGNIQGFNDGDTDLVAEGTEFILAIDRGTEHPQSQVAKPLLANDSGSTNPE
jgi:hypothetical protein